MQQTLVDVIDVIPEDMEDIRRKRYIHFVPNIKSRKNLRTFKFVISLFLFLECLVRNVKIRRLPGKWRQSWRWELVDGEGEESKCWATRD